ncbi:MAG: SIS domain-containing protein [Nostocoides sp.]
MTPAPGPDLVRLAELIALIDFATTYLALGYGLDPASAPAVVDLRALR